MYYPISVDLKNLLPDSEVVNKQITQIPNNILSLK